MNQRLKVLAGIGVGLLLVAFVLPKLLFGGGDGGDEATLTAPPVPPTGAAPAAPAPAGPDAVEPAPETFEVFSTKNPFMPLVAMAPAVAESPSSGGSTVVDEGPVPVPGSFEADPEVQPEPTPTGASGGSATAPRPAQRVAVLEVFDGEDGGPRTSVRVNDTVYEVGEGERFATSYQVVELVVDEGCGQFLFGDDRFRVCEGEELLK